MPKLTQSTFKADGNFISFAGSCKPEYRETSAIVITSFKAISLKSKEADFTVIFY